MSVIQNLLTARLQLRPFQPLDAPEVYQLVSVRDVATTAVSIPHPYPKDGAQTWIATHGPDADAGKALTWAITDQASGTLYGAIAVVLTPAHHRGEIGYWVGFPYWGRGYATEAALSVIEHAFSSLNVVRIQATCLPENHGSARVLEKAGLRYEGLLKGYVLKGNELEDRLIFGLLRSAWEQSAFVRP